MGKSTCAALFKEAGIPVHDSDAAVHMLLNEDQQVIKQVETLWPEAIENSAINRAALGKIIFSDDMQREKLEKLLHPKVQQKQQEFLKAQGGKTDIAILEIPLLYETEAQKRMDYVALASAPAEIQKQRVLARANMTEQKLAAILQRQMPDAEKRKHADFIIDTGTSLENTEAHILDIIAQIRKDIVVPK